MRWWHRRKREEDVERELRNHLELEAEEQRESGLPVESAHYAARRALGNATLVREDTRAVWRAASLDQLRQDVRYAFRNFRKSPQFTCITLLTLALGIGANTGLFSVLNAVLLRTLPVANPEELLRVLPLDKRGEDMGFSWPLFQALQRDQKVFSGIYAASDADPLDLDTAGDEKAVVQMVSGDYFGVLGVKTSLGRSITSEDNIRGAQAVAVISDRFWERHFGRDQSAVGKPITLNHQLLTVVGVAPREFFGDTVGSAPDIWTPVILQPELNPGHAFLDMAGVTFLHVIGRLRSGPESQAEAGLTVSLREIRSKTGSSDWNLFHDVTRLATEPASRGLSELRERFSAPLRLLMALVALVLLLACANIANLLLARAAATQKDVAIRLATGASRARILRQMLAESLLLATLGSLAGLWVGYGLSHVLIGMVAASADRMVLNVNLDIRVLLFTFAASFATGLMFGVGPAVAAIRVDPIQSLKASAPQAGQKVRAGRPLVVVQVALSLLLMTAAGLFVRTLYNLQTFDAGFAREGVVQVAVDAAEAGYQGNRLVQFYNRVMERMNRIPGVRASSFASLDLISGGAGHICCLALPGAALTGNDDQRIAFNTVMPAYFNAVGMTLLAGRAFESSDVRPVFASVVLNESLAKRLFGKKDPIGRYVVLGWGNKTKRLQIIGTVKDARYSHMRESVQAMAYFPGTTDGDAMRILYVRTAGDTRAIIPAVLKELKAIDSAAPIRGVSTMREIIDRDLIQERLIAELSAAFGILALLLAVLGLYGVLAYSVARRTGEIGIRTALGAQRRNVIEIVLADVVWLVGIGLAIGLPAAWAVAHFASSMLFGFSANDPMTFVIAIGALTGASVLASYVPAWRASRVDPLVALRYE